MDRGRDSKSRAGKCVGCMKSNAILIALVFAMCAGVGMGIGLRQLDPPLTAKQVMYLGFPGDLLLRMLKMLILPLIVSSMISGVAALGKASGRMGGLAIAYYMTTTLVAVIIGIILVLTIQPGNKEDINNIEKGKKETISTVTDSLLDLIRLFFPDNLITACFQKQKTEQIYHLVYPPVNETNVTNGTTTTSPFVKPEVVITGYKFVTSSGMNVLGLLVFSIALGLVLANMGDEGRPLVNFFVCLNEATARLITIVICAEFRSASLWYVVCGKNSNKSSSFTEVSRIIESCLNRRQRYSPIGVMFLIAAKLLAMDDIGELFQMLGLYAATVIAGLAIHGLIVLPLLYLIFVRKNPIRYIYGMLEALVTAFGTASSSATLPVTFRCVEKNNNIDTRVSRFVLPIGATINMDGTALYEAVAAIFIAQLNGIPLNVGQVITVSITATLASIGAAGVPSAGLVTMSIVLTAVGLPQTDIGYIVAIDWFLDRFRTMVNVLGDSIGCGIVYRYTKERLDQMDDDEEHGLANNQKVPLGYDKAIGITNPAHDADEDNTRL